MLNIALLLTFQCLWAAPLIEELREKGYVEICGTTSDNFDALYAAFDELIQTNQQKLTIAKERFIRTQAKQIYSTNFFGLYDETRGQIAFYYSTHFHDFILTYYPELNHPFFEACREIQKPCGSVFKDAAHELGVETIFPSEPPILLKVVKYFPSYTAARAHYDGTAFSLFLHSTDNESLLLSPYKSSFTVDDFSSPIRNFNSILLIPGVFLTEFSIYPTPHIVVQSGKTRYATIAFAMRSNYTPQKFEYTPIPSFNKDF